MMGTTSGGRELVLLCGPSPLTSGLSRHITSLLPEKHAKCLDCLRQVQDVLKESGQRISMAILIDLYPASHHADDVVKCIKEIRIGGAKFPIVVLASRQHPDPILTKKGQTSLKLPIRLPDLDSVISSQKNLAHHEWKTVVQKYCFTKSYLTSVVEGFLNHGLKNLESGKLSDYEAFKKDIMGIWNQRQNLFQDGKALAGSLGRIKESIDIVNEVVSNSSPADKKTQRIAELKEALKEFLGDAEGEANE